MTQHDPDVEALIYELKLQDKDGGYISDGVRQTLAKLEPKPEKVYVLPEWEHRTENQIIWCRNENVSHDAWIQLRYFTATDVPAQVWNMPTWEELPLDLKQKWMSRLNEIIGFKK